MRQGAPTRLTATCCGLAAFAIAIIAGLGADNPADEILARALVAMFVCWIAGAIIGYVGERAIDDHLQNLRDSDDIAMSDGLSVSNDNSTESEARSAPANVAA